MNAFVFCTILAICTISRCLALSQPLTLFNDSDIYQDTLDKNASSVVIQGARYTIFIGENGQLMEYYEGNEPAPIIVHNRSVTCGLPVEEYGIIENRLLSVDPFFPGCFPQDNVARILQISIVSDYSFYLAMESYDNAMDTIVLMVAQARLVYYAQLNIVLQLTSVTITTSVDDNTEFPLNMYGNNCVLDTDYVLQAFTTIASDNGWLKEAASVLLVTACWQPPGYVGIAFVGTSCDEEENAGIVSYTAADEVWLVLAHEFGHTIGALHVLDGFMNPDPTYDPEINGTIQFSQENKQQICPYLTQIEQQGCPFLLVDSSGTCGDGILQENEECECLDETKACIGCKNCKLTNPSVQCSIETFVVHPYPIGQSLGGILVSTSLLSESSCCDNGKFVVSECSSNDGVCVNGLCYGVCTPYLLEGCPLTNGGCTQPCKNEMMGYLTCETSIKTVDGTFVSWVPNGAICENGGQCKNGECIV